MSEVYRETVFAGDTTKAWEIGLVTSAPGINPPLMAQLDGAFTCRLVVAGADPAIARVVVTKNLANTRFIAWLTPAETLSLGKGTWTVGIELRNAALVPPLVQEKRVVVRIEVGMVPPA